MKEETLTNALKKGENAAYEHAYRQYFPMIRDYITKNNGSLEDAHDIFQETLIVLVKQLRKPNFEWKAKVSTFLYAIARKMWLYKLRGKKEVDSLDAREDKEKILGTAEIDGIEIKQVFEKKYQLVQEILQTLTKECQQVINAYYFKKLALKEIEMQMGYSKGFGKLKKKRCMDGFKKLILAHPHKTLMTE